MFLDPEAQRRLLDICGDDPERWIVQFALGTGLRQGEQWSLPISDVCVDGDDPHVMVRYGSEGKTTPRGAPKNPLQLGATCWHFRHESRATAPPIWIQNLILPPLAMLAKLFGVRPYRDRWDSRNAPSSEPDA